MRRDILFLAALAVVSLSLAASVARFVTDQAAALVPLEREETRTDYAGRWEDETLRRSPPDKSGNALYPDHRWDTGRDIIPPPAQPPQTEGETPPNLRVEIGFPPAPEREWEVIAAQWAREGETAVRMALAVSWYESRWKPDAANPICCASGLFQITMGTWQNAGCGDREDFWERRLNPAANTACAYKIYQRSGWKEWSVVNEAVEPGRQVKVCPGDPFCRMPSKLRETAEAAAAEREKWILPIVRVVR